jgi:hypothetical protein
VPLKPIQFAQAFSAHFAPLLNDGRILRVVYVADDRTARVLTAFFDRGRRRT